jgi:hypothetical protein
MRWLAAGALLFALTPAAAEARPRAAILFLPYPGDAAPLLHELAKRPGMAIGLTSPAVGGFRPRQMALDMSQGARIPLRLYSPDDPPARWTEIVERAHDAPGDLRPGLLAETIEDAGLSVGYAGDGGPGELVATDAGGRVHRADALVTRESSAPALIVADLPRGGDGLRALRALLAARPLDQLVFVVQAPSGRRLRLLATGVVGGGPGELRSRTTRRTGLIAATDVTPTVLRHLGLRVPDPVQGESIDIRAGADPDELVAMAARLDVVTARRGTCLAWLGLALAALAAIATVLRRARGARAALRIAFLAALWAPGLMLLTAALAPGRTTEAAIIALGSIALAALTDRLAGWPRGPALPVAVVFAAHAVDLARGSPLIARSLAGPNPEGGARFFGIGNELETILSVSVLVGTGAALAWAPARRAQAAAPGSHAPVAFAIAAAVAAVVIGAGRLGADVGAVITLAVGGGAAVVAARGGRPSRRAIALVVAAPIAAIAALIVIDLATGGDAHLSRSVLRAHGGEDVTDVIGRRFRSAFEPLGHPGKAIVFALALAGMAWLARRRERILAALRTADRRAGDARGVGPRAGHPFAAGLIGAFFAVVAGTLGNDSGPLILEIGAVLLALGAGYAFASPSADA